MTKLSPHQDRGLSTRLAQTGRKRSATGTLVNTPVMRASTILFDTYADLRAGVRTAFDTNEPFYGRMGTQSQWSLREAITELEGAIDTALFPSGVAALAVSLLAFSQSGSHILVTDSVYEPLRGIARNVLEPMGVTVDYFPPLMATDIADLIKSNTSAIIVESPGSLTFEIQDIPAIANAAQKVGAVVIADNTWATPLYCNPLALGADISVNACTKYMGGHSDVMMGAASVGSKQVWQRLDRTARALGQIVSPDDSFLALRGIRTLEVRIKQHEKAALDLARWLEGHDAVARVLHPALPSSPGHDIWKRDFKGSTGLFSIILKGGTEPDVAPMVDHLAHFGMGFSWGGFESLILPTDPTSIRTATQWDAEGPLLRLHIGLEDPEDLKADLAAGLERYQTHLSAQSKTGT